MSSVYALVGIPGSGKSTWAKNFKDSHPNTEIISSDVIRKELFGDERIQNNKAKVFDLYYKEAKEYIEQGKDVILDSTNISFKDRKRIFNTFKDCTINAFIFNATREECIERDSKRERSVGVEVIDKFISRFVCPQHYEGFNNIDFVYEIKPFNIKEADMLRFKMSCFDQKNPHHIYSLLDHCNKTGDALLELILEYNSFFVDKNRLIAAYWHDVGKLFTQSIDSEGIAHYYNHDNIGTYYLMTHPEVLSIKIHDAITFPVWDEKNNLLEILFYVNWHMRAHKDLRGERAKEKYIGLFGINLYYDLIEFADCDIKASGTYKGE